MAQKVQVLLVDDIDGSEATETVTFGLDGVTYEIDLSHRNAHELRSELEEYVTHARKLTVRGRRSGGTTRPHRAALDTTAIRNWARENGYDVKDRGRVPADIVAKYQEATGR